MFYFTCNHGLKRVFTHGFDPYRRVHVDHLVTDLQVLSLAADVVSDDVDIEKRHFFNHFLPDRAAITVSERRLDI